MAADDFFQGLIDQADLALGSDHWLRWTSSQAGEQRIGATIIHRSGTVEPTESGWCMGGVFFKGTQYEQDHADERTYWSVASYEPLTISPSVLCGCGDHGWIRDGQWLPA